MLEAVAAAAAEQLRLNRPDGWRATRQAEEAARGTIGMERENETTKEREEYIDTLLARQLERSIARNDDW
jgi:hypothetical protein